MAWVSLCVIALLTGQVGGVKTEPTPAVRHAAADAPKTIPSTPLAKSEPNSPTPPPSTDAAPSRIPREDPWNVNAEIPKAAPIPDAGKIPDAGDIPNAAEIAPRSVPAAEPPPAAVPSAPPKAPERVKTQAQEMVAEALQIPPGGTIVGQPWPLAQVLAVSPDRKQQLLNIHGYWQLAEAVAKYRFAFEQAKQFEELHGRPADDAALRAARAAAAATLRESELAVLSAQNDLAALVGLPAESPLPLPGDKPLVG